MEDLSKTMIKDVQNAFSNKKKGQEALESLMKEINLQRERCIKEIKLNFHQLPEDFIIKELKDNNWNTNIVILKLLEKQEDDLCRMKNFSNQESSLDDEIYERPTTTNTTTNPAIIASQKGQEQPKNVYAAMPVEIQKEESPKGNKDLTEIRAENKQLPLFTMLSADLSKLKIASNSSESSHKPLIDSFEIPPFAEYNGKLNIRIKKNHALDSYISNDISPTFWIGMYLKQEKRNQKYLAFDWIPLVTRSEALIQEVTKSDQNSKSDKQVDSSVKSLNRIMVNSDLPITFTAPNQFCWLEFRFFQESRQYENSIVLGRTLVGPYVQMVASYNPESSTIEGGWTQHSDSKNHLISCYVGLFESVSSKLVQIQPTTHNNPLFTFRVSDNIPMDYNVRIFESKGFLSLGIEEYARSKDFTVKGGIDNLDVTYDEKLKQIVVCLDVNSFDAEASGAWVGLYLSPFKQHGEYFNYAYLKKKKLLSSSSSGDSSLVEDQDGGRGKKEKQKQSYVIQFPVDDALLEKMKGNGIAAATMESVENTVEVRFFKSKYDIFMKEKVSFLVN